MKMGSGWASVFRMSSPTGLGDQLVLPAKACALGRAWPCRSSSAEGPAPDVTMSLVQQVPLLPEEAYRLSASSRSHWRKE